MDLDTGTLMIMGSLALCLSGLWLGWSWLQKRETPALVWWSAANLLIGIGVAGMRVAIGDGNAVLSIVSLLLLQFPPAFVWAGARRFRGARLRLPLVFLGPVVWVAATALLPGEDGRSIATAIGFGGWIAYMLAAIRELWLGRDEVLPARWPLCVLLVIDVCVYAGGIKDALAGVLPEVGQPPLDTWFGLIYFEGILFAMGSAVFMSSLASERAEARLRTAASVDSLTGAASRRAFFEQGGRLLLRAATDGTPASAIVFDLDRFKRINDTFGHQIGDRVLRVFADVARGVLRPGDLFGRHGGEEFAVVLPGGTVDTAHAIAERIRRAFAEAARAVDGVDVGATVSAGVATAVPGEELERLLAVADRGLYRAKAQGRNCVRRADGPPDDGGSKVVRVA